MKKLAATSVPTAKAALSVALGGLNPSDGLRAYEVVSVAGLYTLDGNAPGFARKDDLVWELIISAGGGVSRVVWVSTTTKAVRVLFRTER